MRTHATHSGWRRQAFLLAGLALFLRMLIPSGWMPAQDHLGLMPCSIASAPAVSTIAVAQDQGLHRQHAGSHQGKRTHAGEADRPCAFAGFACALAEPVTAGADVIATAPAPAAIAPRGAAVRVAAHLAAPPPLPTGPPTTV